MIHSSEGNLTAANNTAAETQGDAWLQAGPDACSSKDLKEEKLLTG